MARGSPEAADGYWEARKAAATVVAEAKTLVWEEFRGLGEGLLVGLKEVLVNHLAALGGKAGLSPGCVQSGRRTADLDLGCHRTVEGTL